MCYATNVSELSQTLEWRSMGSSHQMGWLECDWLSMWVCLLTEVMGVEEKLPSAGRTGGGGRTIPNNWDQSQAMAEDGGERPSSSHDSATKKKEYLTWHNCDRVHQGNEKNTHLSRKPATGLRPVQETTTIEVDGRTFQYM